MRTGLRFLMQPIWRVAAALPGFAIPSLLAHCWTMSWLVRSTVNSTGERRIFLSGTVSLLALSRIFPVLLALKNPFVHLTSSLAFVLLAYVIWASLPGVSARRLMLPWRCWRPIAVNAGGKW